VSRESVTTILQDADVPASRLEEWKAAEDARLDALAHEDVRILDVVHDVAKKAPDDIFLREGIFAPMLAEVSKHARSDEQAVAAIKRARHRERRDPDARWGDEVEALRAWCEAPFKNRPGDSGRALERARTGATGGGGPATPIEPAIDDYLHAVGRVLHTIRADDLALLKAAFVELAPPRVRRTKDGKLRDGHETVYVDGRDPREPPSARRLRDDDEGAERVGYAVPGLGLGLGGEASASAVTIARVTADQPGAKPWPELVADRFELAADEVSDRVRRAKKALRDGLRRVELDGEWRGVEANGTEHALTSDEGLAIEAGRTRTVARGSGVVEIARAWSTRPRFLIPPLAMREQARERAREAPGVVVETCHGAEIAGGVRLGCAVGYAPAEDVAACPRCEHCGKARVA